MKRSIEWSISWFGRAALRFSLALAVLAFARNVEGIEIDGFTEPFRTIRVASPEAGIITRLDVKEGDKVEPEQVLAQLDDDVHLALLAIADQSMNAKGRRDATQAEVTMRKARLETFERLRASGHARQEELDRARSELAIAQGQLKAAEEDLMLKKLEYGKIKAQLSRRSVRSPAPGIVSEIHKEEGEFVAANSPEIATIVQLDPLIASFLLTSVQASQRHVEEEIDVHFVETDTRTRGTVRFISPVTDAESGTVRVELRIDNPHGHFRSGERCTIELPDAFID